MWSIGFTLAVMAVAATATVAYASATEHFIHRVLYHRWFERQHAEHHALYDGRGFRQPGPYASLQPWWFEAVIILVHAPAFWLIDRGCGHAAAATALATITAYAALSNYLHTAIHRPAGRRLERTRWYRIRAARHFAHHADPATHFCIPLGLGDRLFGTFTTVPAERKSRRIPAA